MTAAVQFYIGNTFLCSLARLTNDEQKAVKTTAFDLQVNPATPAMGFHKVDKAGDKNFWSVRVNRDVRIIVHKISTSLVLCYVDHHDKAYKWAERQKLVAHPTTGAAQLVEIRETVNKVPAPVSMAKGPVKQTQHTILARLARMGSRSNGLEVGSFNHPDAQLHFHMIANVEELRCALNFAEEYIATTPAVVDLTPVRVLWPEQVGNRTNPPVFGKRIWG
jgi:hypothetical protein